MALKNRNLITIDDLTNPEMEAIFSLSDDMASDTKSYSELCKGYVMATLFYEPSTRTRLSFETAMHKLGGSVVTAAEIGGSSIAKGESLADTARVVGSYVDLIVIRHAWEGAARVMANYAGVPVVNAGDGSHEHPTQTLCDVYTLKKEKGTIQELAVAICGDLKNGRTVHSLTYALARFGANIVFIASKGYELPEYVREKLQREYTGSLTEGDLVDVGIFDRTELGALDAIYQTPTEPHQLALLTDVKPGIRPGKYDVIYATRLQKERHSQQEEVSTENSYVKVDPRLMNRPEFKKALVMHPLPRVDEIAYELDEDPRSMYFKQAAYGVPVRMALLALLLGAVEVEIKDSLSPFVRPVSYPTYKGAQGIRCCNSDCVSNFETAYIVPEFWVISEKPLVLRCVYCERGSRPQSAGSSRTRIFHKAGNFSSRRLKDRNLILFESYEQARKAGFRPGYRVNV